jgi:hypothetical protein
MNHKLLIETAVKNPPKYKPFLKMFEVVRGISISYLFRITNLGVDDFPGGEVCEKCVDFESLSSFPTVVGKMTVDKYKIPKLKKGEQHIIKGEFLPIFSGPYAIRLRIKSKDNQPIEFYQYEGGAIGKDEWSHYMNAIERESIDEIILVKKLIDKRK